MFKNTQQLVSADLNLRPCMTLKVLRTWRNCFTLSLLVFLSMNKCRWWCTCGGCYYNKQSLKTFPHFYYVLEKQKKNKENRGLNILVKEKSASLHQPQHQSQLQRGLEGRKRAQGGPMVPKEEKLQGEAGSTRRARPRERDGKHFQEANLWVNSNSVLAMDWDICVPRVHALKP